MPETGDHAFPREAYSEALRDTSQVFYALSLLCISPPQLLSDATLLGLLGWQHGQRGLACAIGFPLAWEMTGLRLWLPPFLKGLLAMVR